MVGHSTKSEGRPKSAVSISRFRSKSGCKHNTHTAIEMGVKGFAIGAIILGCIAILKANREAGLINEQCLRCLCEASTECPEDTGCTSESPSQYLCGPYAISYHYWKDGGSPGADPSDPMDFERCLTYKPCAEAAVKGYMNRWGKDCDGDGRIDCFDWALLHKAGPEACTGDWARTSDFFAHFKTCYAPFAAQLHPAK